MKVPEHMLTIRGFGSYIQADIGLKLVTVLQILHNPAKMGRGGLKWEQFAPALMHYSPVPISLRRGIVHLRHLTEHVLPLTIMAKPTHYEGRADANQSTPLHLLREVRDNINTQPVTPRVSNIPQTS